MAEVLQNIDLSEFRKKRFTINGDQNKILELDPSDLSIINRLNEAYPKLKELETEVSSAGENMDIENSSAILTKIDDKMRGFVDYIFDAPVCSVCIDHGSMYDPIGGRLRYEILIDRIGALYEANLEAETKKMKARIQKHTDKYIKK